MLVQLLLETVWVGQLLPLEDANRTLAQHARQGVELAVAEARVPLILHDCRQIAVLHVDSREDAATAQASCSVSSP